jgi:hypothetical protein
MDVPDEVTQSLTSLNRCKRMSLANAKPSLHAIASIVSGFKIPPSPLLMLLRLPRSITGNIRN